MQFMAAFFYFSIFIPLSYFSLTEGRAIDSTAIAGCPNKCGEVEISYPFGIGEPRCFFKGFEVVCNQNIPYLPESDIQLLKILQGEVSINSTSSIARTCPPPAETGFDFSGVLLPETSPYTISVSNKFIAIGCSTNGVVMEYGVSLTHCSSGCPTKESVVNSSCEGHGCCTAPLPQVMKGLIVYIEGNQSSISNCSYGFVVEDGSYMFKETDLLDFDKTANISMNLEWSIGGSCLYQTGEPAHICGSNATCSDTAEGYRCKCLDGYGGNPYLNGSQGCQDIDECNESFGSSPCVEGAKCQNMIPGFRCSCPEGSSRVNRTEGRGCITNETYIPVPKSHNPVSTSSGKELLGALLCIGSLALCIFGCRGVQRVRNLVQKRAKYFRKNGGILLQQQVSSLHRSTKYPKIYSAQELKKATDNYHINNVLGSGGNGAVYKGILNDGTVVAIKKSRVVDQRHIDQFINEVVILTEINHGNVVKLLGCCLETQVPMLVYEFISNGTLYQKIHENSNPSEFSWQSRFRIAIETACALSYLHSSISPPIFHRDIKSSNILLDKNYTAKVADFGISRLVPVDKTRVSTMVLGTFGYLDPEYFNTGKLTEKSDVYSFGVVLLELLTGRKPVWPDSSMEYCNLPMVFSSHVRTDNLADILDEKVVREGRIEELQAVADIAMRCLRVKGAERPMMKEIVQEFIALLNGHMQAQQECKAHEFEELGAN